MIFRRWTIDKDRQKREREKERGERERGGEREEREREREKEWVENSALKFARQNDKHTTIGKIRDRQKEKDKNVFFATH